MELQKLKFKHQFLQQVDSTNRYAIELLSNINPNDGFCVISDFQTEGKGQYGRSWQSESGKNILSSFIFNTKDKFSSIDHFVLNVIGSIAVYETLSNFIPSEEIKIKWPNDILIHSKKIAGILIQNIFRGHELIWTVIGIGINVNQNHFENEHKATSLFQLLSKESDRIDLLQILHDQLMIQFEKLIQGKVPLLYELYNEKLFGLHQICNLQKANDEIIQGKIRSVDKYGMLSVEIGNKVQAFDFSSARIILT
ncbi:MAG: biotin--[acetyl-CoA-carboxylase] ligase [Saprospiraceae bacterium]|nr:biotin--[acetyl-CoA-carboxylase] ligase [Saprospiraceae bacterium]